MKIPLEWLKEYVDLNDLTPKEIGLAFTQIGLMEDKPFDGEVFDLEHRFDRADWLSIIGCARDLAAYLNRRLITPTLCSQKPLKPKDDQIIKIKVECPEIINRFNTRVFRNVKVAESPNWLKDRLEKYGIPSINNIVDITNYVMVEIGQPLHAQDLSKILDSEIIIRRAKNGEKITTFIGDEVILYSDAFVLADKKEALVLGGIVGGRKTGITFQTKDIILDAGNYNQNLIRKVSRKLKIQNETVSRYDKFLHPKLTEIALERAAYLILELAGGEYYDNVDWYPNPKPPKQMKITSKRLEMIAGTNINYDKVLNILKKLDYKITSHTNITDKEWEDVVEVPYYRTDIEVEDDIISDILRINGYQNIQSSQIQCAPPNETTPKIYILEEKIKDYMVQLGGYEHITDPLVMANPSSQNQIVLENSLNFQKNALRENVGETLSQIVSFYYKNKINEGLLFEIGKFYKKENEVVYKEIRALECLAFNMNESPKSIYKLVSSTLRGLFKCLGIKNFEIQNENGQRTIKKENTTLGYIRYNGFTLLTENLLPFVRDDNRVLTNIIDLTTLDLSFLLKKTTPVNNVITALQKIGEIKEIEFIEEYNIDNENRSILFRIKAQKNLSPLEIKEKIKRGLQANPQTQNITLRS